MRGPRVLLMDNFFNDWDLQAVVRSCSFAHADDAAAGAAAPAPEPPEPAPPRPAAALQERRAHARAAPLACRPAAATVVAASNKQQEAASRRLYGLDYLDLDHKPSFLLPTTSTTTAAMARGAGDDGREVMISFPAASTSGVQSRAVPPGRKAGARGTPRPKRRYYQPLFKANFVRAPLPSRSSHLLDADRTEIMCVDDADAAEETFFRFPFLILPPYCRWCAARRAS